MAEVSIRTGLLDDQNSRHGLCMCRAIDLRRTNLFGRCIIESIILTISGKTASSKAVVFTRSQLEVLGSDKIVTTTPWHTGAVTFERVPMKRLMETVGATGNKIVA